MSCHAFDIPDDDEILADDKILAVATPDEVLVDTTAIIPTSKTTLKDQVLTSEKIMDEELVETLRTPDKNGPTGTVPYCHIYSSSLPPSLDLDTTVSYPMMLYPDSTCCQNDFFDGLGIQSERGCC